MAAAPVGKVWRQLEDLLVGGQLGSLSDSELLERFLGERDEAAFAALVERHGPMVLGTCRSDGQPWGLEGELDLHPLGQYTKIGKDGRFRAEGLTPGKAYRVMLRKKGSPFNDFGLAAVTVEPGETEDVGDIVPRPPR